MYGYIWALKETKDLGFFFSWIWSLLILRAIVTFAEEPAIQGDFAQLVSDVTELKPLFLDLNLVSSDGKTRCGWL